MFSFLRKKSKSPESNEPTCSEAVTPATPESGFFQRLRHGLAKTRKQFTEGLASLFLGKKEIDANLLEALQTQLLLADVGIETTEQIIKQLTQQVERKNLNDPEALLIALSEQLCSILEPCEKPLELIDKPTVLLMVGVNGAGKTTTIGKLAKLFQAQNHQVILAAGDTFRAAAIEQLQQWGQKIQVPVIAQQSGADSASVIFDAYQAAKSRHADVLLADSAGRLHTKGHLMQELQKIKRVLQKQDPKTPQEVILILDATTGQNALRQAEQFHQDIGLTGLIVTKLDGTAKGGILFALAHRLKLPIYYLGLGESADDLRPFTAKGFVDALLSDDHNE